MTSSTIDDSPADDAVQKTNDDQPSKREPLVETVFTPESAVRHPLQLLRDIAIDLVRGRELAWRLLLRNLSSQYRQTMFGYVWAFLPPLATTALFAILNSSGVLNIGVPGDAPYLAFLLIGTVLWQFFADAVSTPLFAATQSKPMLAKVRFPREAILVSAAGEVLFKFLIRFVIILPVFFFLPDPWKVSLLLVPLGVAAIMLVGTAIGIWLTPLGLLYQDVAQALPMVLQFWMFVSGVIYPVVFAWPLAAMIWLNPATAPLYATRDWILYGETAMIGPLLLMCGVGFVWLISGLIFYRLSMPILIERMSA